MSKKTLTFIILWLAFVSLKAQEQKGNDFFEHEKLNFLQKKNFKPLAESQNYNIIYHRIFWEVNPANDYIKGKVTSYFKARANMSSISFDLADELNVDSILQRGKKLNFVHQNQILEIQLTESLINQNTDSLTIFYQGTPGNHQGFGSFETSTHNGTPVMWTLSEPYGAKDWWPCKQTLTDKIDSIDIIVQAPKGNRVASNGILVSEKEVGDKVIVHWKHRYPITTYLVAIAVTNYKEIIQHAKVDDENQVKILNYVYPENFESAKNQTAYTVDVMELFSKKFIPYPFYKEKYGHAQFGWGGGMEHQTMSFMGGFSKRLIAHELAHQWFGNYVTCASWQDIWVNEGFASFCEGIAIENLHPNDWHNWKKSNIEHVVDNTSTGSVFVNDTTSVSRIFNNYLSYDKASMVLHMLRYQIGDEPFFAAIQEMLTHESTSNGFANTQQVQQFFEQAADTNLTGFFQQWIYGQGYPKYTIYWMQNMDNTIEISLKQMTTHASVPFFSLNVPLLFKGASDEKLVKFRHTTDKQKFSFNPGFVVTSIEFDPNYEIIAPHPANLVLSLQENSIEESIVLSPNPVKDNLLIKVNRETQVMNLDIVNSQGKRVYYYNNTPNSRKINIAVNQFPEGSYFLRIQTADNTLIRQVIIN